MFYNYYDKSGRHQWRTYCDTCHALVDDTAPGKDKLSWENRKSEICPKCGGQLYDPDAPKWSPPIR
jgi:rRNA maturation endonuclease Nob1